MPEHSPISRRQFLQRSATLTTGGVALLSPPAYASVVGANARIRVGLIGLGAMGSRHLVGLMHLQGACNVGIIQTCDVYRKRAEAAARKAGRLARPTPHHEDVFGNPSIDAVVIATPDHWHARMAAEAIRANKHVYLEPPLGPTAEQAWELFQVAQDHGDRVRVQVGARSAGFEIYDRLAAYLKDPGVGRLVQVHSSFSPSGGTTGASRSNGRQVEEIAHPRRAGLDWDRWLGHRYTFAGQALASPHAWDPHRYFHFRCYRDYAGGLGSDLVFDRLTALLKGTGLEHPCRAVAGGGTWQDRDSGQPRGGGAGASPTAEVPDRYNIILEYPGGATVTLIGTPTNPGREYTAISGEEATIRLNDPDHPTRAEIRARTSSSPRVKAAFTGRPGGYAALYKNFFQACRDAKVKLHCPVGLAIRSNIALCLSAKAYQDQRVYSWAPEDQMGWAG
jgi:predicted dehydrogenase